MRRLVLAALLLSATFAAASAQRAIEPEPLPPLPPAPGASESPPPPPTPSEPPKSAEPLGAAAPPQMPAAPPAAGGPELGRIFCEQSVTFHLADRDAVPEAFRPFVGIWSDAAWTPQLCAALIVETVGRDGLASIIYAFGPMGSNTKVRGGILHGTGIIRDGELRFQNSDGSQYTFKPIYSDLDGHLTTRQGQNYGAIFKKSF